MSLLLYTAVSFGGFRENGGVLGPQPLLKLLFVMAHGTTSVSLSPPSHIPFLSLTVYVRLEHVTSANYQILSVSIAQALHLQREIQLEPWKMTALGVFVI